jgi:RND family efflux transporter MFP subunit
MEVLVEEGDTVQIGQPLVLLDTTTTELSRREAQAEIQRLQASIQNEARRVQRYRDLKTRDMMPEERMDDAEAKLAIDRAALEAAEARLSHATLVSPVDGVVDKRHVSVGDYVKIGGPLMSVTDTHLLQAELPFPETVGAEIAPGQAMFLTSPVAPGVVVEVPIETIRPQVGSLSRALVVLASVTNPGPWKPGATIEARVIIDRRPNAVVVPTIAVVRRPAGEVVYALDDPASRQVSERVVTVGQRKNGLLEITAGLEPGTVIVADGAPYLSDGALVTVRDTQP